MSTARLLMEIARCSSVVECLADSGRAHCCSDVVRVQGAALAEFQVPEPWSGDLERAPILFLGSNPSISSCEDYPRWSWSNALIADFFTHRFGGGDRRWVKDGRFVLHRDGTYAENWVRYWAATRRRAAELLGRSDGSAGRDYVMSEVVHCKSRREVGISSAPCECVGRYLGRMVEASGATVVVALGEH